MEQSKTSATFEKIENYITKVAKRYGATIEKSERSRYFKFNDRILRLSNHIGKNSSGAISIIVPNVNPNHEETFILHVHSSGSIRTVTLSQLKEFIRTFAIVSDFMEPLSNNAKTFVLGYPWHFFTEGQMKQIKAFINQNKTSKE